MSKAKRQPPPPGPPWDSPWNEAPFAFVDLEMTGLDAAHDRVIQICIERVVGGQCVERLCSFVRPEPLKPAVLVDAVHGITLAELDGAPSWSEVLPRVRSLLDGAVFVAHSARHDVAFLIAESGRSGESLEVAYPLDTVVLARRALEASSYRLGDLCRQLAIDNPRPHRADNDVCVLRALFSRLVSELRPRVPRDLWLVTRGRGVVRPELLAAVEQARGTGTPIALRYRPSRGGQQRLLFVVTAVRTDLDPPVVLGYLHDTRARRELRVDRIAAIEPRRPTPQT
jgi:DNA polymerase III epsilon subunit-like protein